MLPMMAAITGILAAWPGVTWPAIKARIGREFPAVRPISADKLATQLAGKNPPLLLDVRTAPEFEVSHLANARRIDPDGQAIQIRVPKSSPIVTYCSVGYRSAAFASRLQAAGFSNVQNLDGSIFQWANEGRPMTGSKVHPYNRIWGTLLNAPLRAELP